MFTHDEINLICIFNTASRTGLIEELTALQTQLEPDEVELSMLSRSALSKLQTMSDEDFVSIDFVPDYGDEEE